MPTLQLRAARPADLLALYDICLRTGDSGQDARTLYRDPLLLGHLYAGPYLTLCPGTCLVLDDGLRAVGYVLSAPDSADFAARSEQAWFGLLRGLYPLPAPGDESRDARLIRAIHRGLPAPTAAWAPQYPAHLHIDLLPAAQGSGHGRQLIETLFAALRARGVPGVHLGVGRRNTNAQGFYARLGFTELDSSALALTLGMRLD